MIHQRKQKRAVSRRPSTVGIRVENLDRQPWQMPFFHSPAHLDAASELIMVYHPSETSIAASEPGNANAPWKGGRAYLSERRILFDALNKFFKRQLFVVVPVHVQEDLVHSLYSRSPPKPFPSVHWLWKQTCSNRTFLGVSSSLGGGAV